MDFFISKKKNIFAFIELNIIVLMAAPLLSALLVRLWYNYASGKVNELFFHAGIHDLKNNLEEPMCQYLSLGWDVCAFLKQIRVFFKMKHEKGNTPLVGK